MSHVAKLLKCAREDAGLSQGDVAKKLGYSSAQFLSNCERGIATVPFDKIRQYADILEINPDRIIEAMIKDEREKLIKFEKQLWKQSKK